VLTRTSSFTAPNKKVQIEFSSFFFFQVKWERLSPEVLGTFSNQQMLAWKEAGKFEGGFDVRKAGAEDFMENASTFHLTPDDESS